MNTGTAARSPLKILLAGLCAVMIVLCAALIVFLVGRIATYGLFWDSAADQSGTWGGPSLAGAWIVHALIALPMGLAAFALAKVLHNAKRKLVKRA